MELGDEYLEVLGELADTIRAMGPYREDIVIAGGLVPLLYRFHPDFRQPRQSALLTKDLDFTVPESLPLRENRRLRDCLEEAGFVVVPSRTANSATPPKHYIQRKSRGTDKLAEVHGEFLIPLTGAETDRNNRPRSPREIQDGLTAEALRFLDLLLWRPVSFDLGEIDSLSASEGLTVSLPRMGPYAVQKALCSDRRDRTEKRDKDLAYIFDVAMITHGSWPHIRREISELRRESDVWASWIDTAKQNLETAFVADHGFGPDAVERVYQGASVRADTVKRVVRRFIEEVGFDQEGI